MSCSLAGRYLDPMMTIYSIGRAVSSNRIAFPSVFSDGGDWEISCRGGSLRKGHSFLVFGEMRSVRGERMLALSFAETVEGFPFFCRVAGVAGEDGLCEGWIIGRGGAFAGGIFAVDGDKILMAGGVFGEDSSEEEAEAAGGGVAQDEAGSSNSCQKDEREVSCQGAAAEGGLKVIKPVVREDFPVGDAIPELGAVKRDDLARKAEARRKDDGKGGKKAPEAGQKVSKGGLRLGKDSPGDKAGPGGQNTIDESELW